MTVVRSTCGVYRCREDSVKRVKMHVKSVSDPVEVPLCSKHLSVHNEGAARLRVEKKSATIR
jgi:hypothetical protein